MSFNQISFGEPKRSESPSVSVRPPTEGRPATLPGNSICHIDSSTATTRDITLPSGLSGDRLFAFVASDDENGTVTTPTGWTLIDPSPLDATQGIVNLYYRDIDGSETVMTVATSSNTTVGAIIWVLSNGAQLPAPEATMATAVNGQANPPSITPSAGAGSYWVFAGAYATNQSFSTESEPSGYDAIETCGTTSPALNVTAGSKLADIVTSEDPDPFGDSVGATRVWGAFTIAVPQAGDPALPKFDHTHTLSADDITDIDITTTAPVIGDLLEYDGTDFVPQYRDRYVATASKTIADTTTETTLFGTGEGTLTFPADFFSAGRTVKFRLSGQLTDTGTPNQTIRIKLGGSTLTSETEALSGVSGVEWVMDGTITCRTAGASGTFIASALFDYDAGSEISLVGSSETTLDTTGTLTFDLTWQWGTADASNTVTCQTAIVS